MKKLLLLCILAGALSVHAQTVTITTPENSSTAAFGPGGSAAYGQTFTVPVNTNTLQSFTFTGVQSTSGTPFLYNTYIFAYNTGTNTEVGPAIYVSGTETLPAAGAVSSSISPNVLLTPGGTYVVFVSATGQTQTGPNDPAGTAAMGVDSTGSYADGYFVYNNNTGSFVNGATATPFTAPGFDSAFTAIFAQVMQGFDTSGLTPSQAATVGPINQGVNNGNTTPAFTALVTALGTLGNLGAALDQLSPIAFGRFTSTTAFNNATFDVQGRDDYLAGRRVGLHGTFLGGNGNIDSSGLTINDPAYDSSLAMVHSRLLAWNPGSLSSTISDISSPLLGGMDMKNARKAQNSSVAEYTNPWNFYIRGNGIVAQGFSQPGTPHFDDTTASVELGADYRLTPNFLVGLTAGFAHTDADLDNFGSTATIDSYSPGFYASYANHGWYANLQGNYIHNAYTQDRHIDFLGQTASSAPQGNEGVADLDGGYEFHHGAFTYGPLAGLTYTHLSVNGYTESGSIADLSVQDQETDSLRSRLGGRIQYAFSDGNFVFRPHFEASWQHEFMDGSRGITSSLDAAGLGSFDVRTSNPGRDFVLTDLGIDAEINRNLAVFFDYVVQAGQDNYFGQSFQGGVKLAF